MLYVIKNIGENCVRAVGGVGDVWLCNLRERAGVWEHGVSASLEWNGGLRVKLCGQRLDERACAVTQQAGSGRRRFWKGGIETILKKPGIGYANWGAVSFCKDTVRTAQ